MGRHCAAYGCTNNSLKASCKDSGISFHSFPLHDPGRLQKWLINLRRKDFVPNTYSSVCSEHFRKDDFFHQMFTKTRLLKKNAVPIKFGEKPNEDYPKAVDYPRSTKIMKPESKMKSSIRQCNKYKYVFGKRELRCNKCGFVTFSLHLLYNHKHKCTGQLLGKPLFCSYCKRKFSFLFLYRKHKEICVRKASRKRFLQNKLAKKNLADKGKATQTSSYKYSLSCPICHASFKSKLNFVDHLKQQSCNIQQTVTKKSFSARKSLNSHKSSKVSNIYDKKIHSQMTKYEDSFNDIEDEESHRCLWCKNVYPSEHILFMHFKMNEECALAYYKKHCPDINKKTSITARKTISVAARKSFPQKKYRENKISSKVNSNNSRTARKTFASSSKKGKSGRFHQLTLTSRLNQCPVCHENFDDTFTFYQHQKLSNHWGKATKTLTVSCKCPFCDKEFMHVKSRNAHIFNHSDKSEKQIMTFLKSCTCDLCSQSFVSELAKFQHMKIEHPDRRYSASGSNTASDNDYKDKQKMSSVPSSVKKKLKQQPNSCPVCSKAFSHTVLRNKHFNEVHLKIFECQFCSTKFKSVSSLSNHIQLVHGRNLECKGCGASFNNELEILQHILKYHPHQDPKLLLPSNLIKYTSPKEKYQGVEEEIRVRPSHETNSNNNTLRKNIEYYCDICDIGYQKLYALQQHRKSKFHKDTLEKKLDAFHKTLSNLPSSSPPTVPRVVKRPEIITCSECSDEFTNIKDFVPHRLGHFGFQNKYLRITELNPYMCEICSDVLDTHSKVQLHLFWHLQVESTSNYENNPKKFKNDTIMPDRHSGLHVAKKSFGKPNNAKFQEIVIGGVTKPFYECEACNVGFTTEKQYNIHVQKICKKQRSFKPISNFETNINDESLLDASSETEIIHCKSCNFLFVSEAKFGQHKNFCVKCHYDSDSEEILNNSEVVKSALSQQTAMAGCVTCAVLFDNIADIEIHITAHQTDENAMSDDVADFLHCALCNSLLSFKAFKEHKSFCKIPVNIDKKMPKSKHTDVLKSALELKCAVAACISCGLPFNDLEAFSEHLALHQTNQIQIDLDNERDNTYAKASTNALNSDSETSLVDNDADLVSNIASFDQEAHLLYKNLDVTENSSASLMEDGIKKSITFDLNQTQNNLKVLRENFSQLLSLLISDTQLMKTLGYGKLEVDRVLINVLEQMGENPSTDNGSEIDLFRRNIKILLGKCLKPQFLQAIGKEKSADEMVVEALDKLLNAEMSYDSD